MHILHYTLGFPPYRSGGLVRYASDLMIAEKKLGHKVFALYPGSVNIIEKRCHVRRDKLFNGLTVYELVNPLPVPLLYGVKNVEDMMEQPNIDINGFCKLLDEISPDIFHVHTLMGLPLEFLRIAKSKGIRTVFTSHDYFGICLKVNFINTLGQACNEVSVENCKNCNANAKSTTFLRFRNTKFLSHLKPFLQKIIR